MREEIINDIDAVKSAIKNDTVTFRTSLLLQLVAVIITGSGFYFMTNSRLNTLEEKQRIDSIKIESNNGLFYDTRERIVRIETILSQIKEQLK